MKDTDKILQSAGETVEYARLYLEQQGDIIRLEAAERTAKVTSGIVTVMVLGVLVLMVLAMLSVAAGFWLAQALDSVAQAFLLVAIFYALLGAMIYFFRRQVITNPTLDFILQQFFEEEKTAPELIEKHYLENQH